MPTNPHPVLDHLPDDEVGKIQVRDGHTVICDLPPNMSRDDIIEELHSQGVSPGKYLLYGIHYSTTKQMKGYRELVLHPPGGAAQFHDQPATPEALSMVVFEQQMAALERTEANIAQARSELAEERRELAKDRRLLEEARAEAAKTQHSQEINLERQRHAQAIEFQANLSALEREREERHAERQRELDAKRHELELERQKMTAQLHNQRIELITATHESTFQQFKSNMDARMEQIRDEAQQTHANADPYRLLTLLPSDTLSKIVEAQLPSKDDDDANDLLKQLQPLTALLAALRPGGAAAALPTVQPQPFPPAPSNPTGPSAFKG